MSSHTPSSPAKSASGQPSVAIGDVVSGIVLAALGVFIVNQASEWEFLGHSGPGPGFFPTLYGIAMTVVALVLVGHRIARRRIRTGEPASWPNIGFAIATWVAFAAMIPLMTYFGFIIAFAIFAVFMMVVVFGRPVVRSVIAAILSAAAFQVVFPILLQIRLPVGKITGF